MKIKRNKKTTFRESAASSDLAFILIIYFLVIAGFNVNMGFIINLPVKDSSRLVLREELLHFEMDNRGSIIYSGVNIDLVEAEGLIYTAVSFNPDLIVLLSINGEAPWQQVLNFVELAQKLEIESFSFNLMENS